MGLFKGATTARPSEIIRENLDRTEASRYQPPDITYHAILPVAASEACRRFVAVLQDEFGEGELRWSTAFENYELLARERGWPALSQIALIAQMIAVDCSVAMRDEDQVLRWPRLSQSWRRPFQLRLPL